LKLITTAEFEAFFQLDSPGYFIAKKAVEQGEVSAAADVLEVLVLANKLFKSELSQRVALALGPHGKAKQYLESLGTDRAQEIAIEIFGADRLKVILRETADYVKQEFKNQYGRQRKDLAPRRLSANSEQRRGRRRSRSSVALQLAV
jgi:hypothetical protein